MKWKGSELGLPYVGYMTVRDRSILHKHFKRHIRGDNPATMFAMITCNGAIALPKWKGDPIIFGESGLYNGTGIQVSCHPGARVITSNLEAGEINGNPAYYVRYSDLLTDAESLIAEFIRKACVPRPRAVPPIDFDPKPRKTSAPIEGKCKPVDKYKFLAD